MKTEVVEASQRRTRLRGRGSAVALCVSIVVLWLSGTSTLPNEPAGHPPGEPYASNGDVPLPRSARPVLSPAAADVIARYEQAAGGAAVRQARSLQLTAKFSAPTAARPLGRVSASFLAPRFFDQRRTYRTASGHSPSLRDTLAGGRGWASGRKIVMPGVSDPATHVARAEFLRLMLGLLPARLVTDGVVVAGSVRRHDSPRPLDCVSLAVADGAVRAVCFDAASGLTAEVRCPGQLVIRLSDYRAVDGVKLPHEVRYLTASHVSRLYEAVSYVVNPALTPEMFRQDDMNPVVLSPRR